LAQNGTGTYVLPNIQITDAGKYTVTYAQCGKESLPDSATIVISTPPAPTVSGKFDYCLNEQFEPVTVNGTNPNWYYVPVGGSPMPVVPTISTATPNTLVHYVSQTDQFGCESIERTMVRFRAAPRPAPPIVNTPIYYCEEAVPDELFAVGDSLKWYYAPTGGVPTVVPPIPNTSKNDSSAFYVSQTVDGCESDRSVIDVVVTFKPNGQILTDLDNICELDSVIVGYFGSAFPGSQYNWSFTGPGGISFLSELDQDTIRIKLDSAGIHTIGLRVGSKGCLSDLYTAEIYVADLPEGVIAAKSDACLGQAELIEAREYTAELDSFMWDFDGGVTQHATTEQGPYGIYWTEPGEKYIKVTFINQGCYNYAYDTIMVHPKPSANILATYDVFSSQARNFVTVDYKEGDEICMSDSLKVTPDIIEPGATYKWTPTRFFDTYSDIPVTYARVDFNSHIYLEVEDVYGCQNKDSLKILTKSCCEMLFPNAFTPNNDGNNDVFRPITVGNREIETFRVVNRYGQTVYESAQGHLGWDGTFKGQPADLGTYFYLISFMCEKEKVDQGGEVILVR
jgi:gliding motility-associated-like protein